MATSVTREKQRAAGAKTRAGSRRAPSKGRAAPDSGAELGEPVVPDELAAGLARSVVYRKVPPALRARIDRAILMPSEGDASVGQVAGELKLAERYGITEAALQTYVEKVETLMRPAVRSQIMAAVLSCLPREYRRRLFEGSQVLMVSRVLGALTNPDSGLSVAEMAKLAAILHTMSGGRAARAHARMVRRGGSPASESGSSGDAGGSHDASRLPESIRLLYGLPWPPEGASSPPAG